MPLMRHLFPVRLLVTGPMAASLLLNAGCGALGQEDGDLARTSLAKVPAANAAATTAASTHWPVPPPPAMDAAQPVLWVALARHLAPQPGLAPDQAPPLRLESGAGDLGLIDADGQRFSAHQLLLHWRAEPLASPLRLRRLMLGPFPSHESAESVAAQWRRAGADPVIAHPADWEVWAPAAAPVPEGLRPRLIELAQTARLGLELRRADGVVALRGPLRLETPGGLSWKGGLHAGPFRLQGDAYGSWSLVEEVPLERYLEGVLPHEIGAGSPPAALEAQAVLARTWALRNRGRYRVDGFHLCADIQCQVYGDPRQAGAAERRAIQLTRHQVLVWGGIPIHAVYHASNGGVSAGFEEVWSGEPLPYLQPMVDGPAEVRRRFPLPLEADQVGALLREGDATHGADHPRFRWRRLLTGDQIRRDLADLVPDLGQPQQVRVVERGPSGRVLALEISGSGASSLLWRDNIRRVLGQLPSTLFLVTPDGPDRWLFEGGGFGHGAGLSQAGAIDLARRGWSLGRILAHYYPGASLQPLGALDLPP